MSVACQFSTAAEPGCTRRALPGKEFCAPHSRVAGSVEELAETEALGAGTAAEIAEQLALAEMKTEVAKPAPRRRATPAAPVDPEILGSQIAEQLVARETAQRLHRAKARAHNQERREDGTALPGEALADQATFRVRPRRTRTDATRIVDGAGKSLVKPGWVPRWVRQVDHLNRPTESRVDEFKDFGYEVILDPATNQPLTSRLGVALQAPPQQYALRVQEYSPPGALNRADLYDDTRVAIEEANHRAGDEIARMVEEPSHNYSRQWHAPAGEAD